MNRLNKEKRVRVIAALIEGNSIRSTVRMTGVAKNTVTKLLCDIGQACEEYQDRIMVNLSCKRMQVDEIWSFCYAKPKNLPEKYKGKYGYGNVWTFVALDPDTKLVPTWLIGIRNKEHSMILMFDLAKRLVNRVQLTTDAYSPYYEAVCNAFKGKVDYAQLMKAYFKDESVDKKYSPSHVVCSIPRPRIGNPDYRHISTSYIERQNLTMRMQMRRFTRLTNGFSRKIENLQYAVALHFMNYNFCRIHGSLRITPAMAAGVSDHLWDLEEIVELLEKCEKKSN